MEITYNAVLQVLMVWQDNNETTSKEGFVDVHLKWVSPVRVERTEVSTCQKRNNYPVWSLKLVKIHI